ncbi:MAG: DNA cytosine methyltransferase [Nitrosarchaeum sp.]|nr:DNA cytosine methyltransferase [Nitrosarchaeum sp.]
MKRKSDDVYFVDLFSGAGGLSCGLGMAGMKCALAVDNNKEAIKTFEENHRGVPTYVDDVSRLKGSVLKKILDGKKISLVCGGPPCQGMSTVGEGIPDDPRNFLFLQFVRIVKTIRPEFVLMENVTGLLGKKNEKILNGVLKEFNKIGYTMHVRVMSAENYGVPQKRRRTIFIGNRMGYENEFPLPTHGKSPKLKPVVTIGDVIKDMKTDEGKIFNHDVESANISKSIVRKRVERIPEGCGIRYEEDEKEFLPKSLWLGVDWNTIDEGRLREEQYHRLGRKEVAPTIMTSRHTYFHPVETRYITCREAAAIQSFPNHYKFVGTVSQQQRQIGNAVPPLLAKALGKAIIKMIREKKKAATMQSRVVRHNAFDYEKDLTEDMIPITKFVSA